MNYTIIPKSIKEFQTGGSKPVDIYVWATINLCSDYKTHISHISESKLSKLTGIHERAVRRCIKRLKDTDHLKVYTRISEGFIKHNSYYLKPDTQNYFLLDNRYFHKGYDPKVAGFLLLLKSVCINNTDLVLWSKSQIAEAIGLSRNTTSALLNECVDLGLLKALPKGLEITEDCFINPIPNDTASAIYKEIGDFCRSKGAIPPKFDKRAITVILTKYNIPNLPTSEPSSLTYQLNTRCKTLPKKITWAYLLKVLNLDERYKSVYSGTKFVKIEFSF